MRKALLYLSIVFAAGCIAAPAQTDSQPAANPEPSAAKANKYEVQFQLAQESLSGGRGTWRIASMYVERRLRRRAIIWGTYRVSSRNSTRDQEFIGGGYRPFGKRSAVTGEVMFSNTGNYVGRFSVMGEAERKLGSSYVGHFGTRYTSYATVKALTSYGLIEKYWGNNRAAYTVYVTRLTNAGTAPTHRFQYTRYFGEDLNSVGATYVFGREHENLGPNVGILRSKTWSIAGSARHWLSKKVGVSFDALIHRQGDLYYRRGANVGFRYRF